MKRSHQKKPRKMRKREVAEAHSSPKGVLCGEGNFR